MAEYRVDLTEEQVKMLQELAAKRGVNANTIIQQAISTEKLIADNVEQGDDLLIKKGDKLKRVVLKK